MAPLTIHRVVVASIFLPYTVSFNIEKDRDAKLKKADELCTAPIPNLIEGLASKANPQQQQEKQDQQPQSLSPLKSRTSVSARDKKLEELSDQLFSGQNETQPTTRLVQPTLRSHRHPGEPTKVIIDNIVHQARRASIDSSKIFADAPWSIVPARQGNGGLVNAINSVKQNLTKQVWVGTLGMSTDALNDKMKGDIKMRFAEYDCIPVIDGVTDIEFDGHYNAYCKQVLWPTFHYVVLDNPKSKVFEDDHAWNHYVTLNQHFADTIVAHYQPGDIIWINDYHLMLVPELLRKKLPNAIIGFFLHVPFPSSELFRCLAVREELLKGILGSDLIGFQTYSFARHFLQTCSRILSLETSPKGIQMENNFVSVGIFPIGIDLVSLNEKRRNPEVADWIKVLKEKYAGKTLIVARDKLDYIKGIRQKLLAFEQFLIRYPEWQGKVVLIQVALSTSEQNELQAQLTDVISRINHRFSNLAYQPVIYLHQDISFSQYLALLTAADCCLITPLRDGMNLTSHEYVVCQEGKYAPLILSEFAGTYGSFGACFRVNPWDYRSVAEAIEEALTINAEEREARWKELYKNVTTNTAQYWTESFISECEKIHTDMQRRCSIHIPHLNPRSFIAEFQKAKRRLFLLDYDGTIVPYEKDPSAMENASHRLFNLLKSLTADKRNEVWILSGRTTASLEERFSDLPSIGLVAENGAYLQHPGAVAQKWECLVPDMDIGWKKEVLRVFEYYTERTPGSFIEEKNASVVWHYRKADHPTYGAWQASECLNHISDSLTVYPIHAFSGNKNVEVLPRDVSKSSAVNRILSDITRTHGSPPDFIICIGDDRSDEDMFDVLNKAQERGELHQAITVTVGSKSSEAKFFVSGVPSVLSCLEILVE
ncbi:uncharacterized protein VTP21DRAFT_7335 [Calcarisporiella thermophila]|uniref:uncharacterized protein n=1 Tax=Calcarisporiella thermophila TaxID=911321 RepID=UPI0037422F26